MRSARCIDVSRNNFLAVAPLRVLPIPSLAMLGRNLGRSKIFQPRTRDSACQPHNAPSSQSAKNSAAVQSFLHFVKILFCILCQESLSLLALLALQKPKCSRPCLAPRDTSALLRLHKTQNVPHFESRFVTLQRIEAYSFSTPLRFTQNRNSL